MDNKSNKRNLCIDMLRYISSIMVVAIHSHPFENWSSPLYSLVQNICTVAVPFFFAISGFFYFQLHAGKTEKVKKYLKHTLETYMLWSFFYGVIAFVEWGHIYIGNYCKEMVICFFFYGTSYHLWFIPVLIYTVLLYCVLGYFFTDKVKYICLPICLLGSLLIGITNGVSLDSAILTKCIKNSVTAMTYFSLGGGNCVI